MAKVLDSVTVLVVEDDPAFSRLIVAALAAVAEVTEAATLAAAIGHLQQRDFDVVLTDLRLGPSEEDTGGLDLLRHIQLERPGLPVVVMSAFGDEGVSVRAMLGGAYFYLAKPPEAAQLRSLVTSASRGRKRLVTNGELRYLCPVMTEVLRMVRAAGEEGNVSVLLTGDTGTGKEILATELHRAGRRRNAPFVALSLVGSSPQLIESDIFGHERGAFTGAVSRRLGCLEQANQGVLFLDEIDSLPLEGQAKLLRVLETREFVRLGGHERIRVELQLVAATRNDLPTSIRSGLFRDDLYFRIAALDLHLPPLRSWGSSDIERLACEFLSTLASEGRTSVAGISEGALAAMKRYSWPGNVRELRNAVATAAVRHRVRGGRGDIMDVDLPRAILDARDTASREQACMPLFSGDSFDLKRAIESVEMYYIREALAHFNGSVGKASMLLYGDRNRLARRLQAVSPDRLRNEGELKSQKGAQSD